MPVVQCPDCGLVISWRGKSLSFPCPNDHGGKVWAGRTWRRQGTLHVDRDGIELNGHDIDARLPDLEAGRGAGSANLLDSGGTTVPDDPNE